MVDTPGFILFLLVVLLVEVGYILFDTQVNWTYFRDYIDAIVILTFFCATYFIFGYFRNQAKAPNRLAPLQKKTFQDSRKYQHEEI